MLKRYLTYLGFNGASLAISMLSLPVVTRLMTPAEFGKTGLALSIVAFLSPLISLSADAFLPPQRANASPEEFSSLQTAIYCFSVATTLLLTLLLLVGLSVGLFGPVMMLVPLLCLGRALRAGQQSLLVFDGAARVFGISGIALSVLSLIFAVGFLYASPSAMARIFSLVVAELLVATILMRTQWKWGSFQLKNLWPAVAFAMPLALATLPAWLINEYGKFFLASRMSMADVGVLSLAFQLGFIYMQFTAAVGNVHTRTVMRDIRGATTVALNLQVLGLLFATLLLCWVAITFFGRYVFDVRYLAAFDVIGIVLLGYFFQSLALLPSLYFNFHGKTRYRLLAITAGAVVNLTFLYSDILSHAYTQKVATGFTLAMLTYAASSYLFMLRTHCAKKTDS